ncbi:Na+/H+ antiporter subunit G [Marinobacter lipolyticus]|uniref:cation:proton antiporter n=1 Tax=Marinobacter lipolyticus TaxID=209639 RepID=UPI001BD110C9|nr:monovalent cation/H(+) antiporter subunit G [Marinobacter lipolyticus]MBS8241073.1 Na+/H+ antiporter subunit G [Marinobacter lipolyticus]
MDAVVPWVQGILLMIGCAFFAIGTFGLFRFTDTLTRIHALTKVDNLGLGFIALALLFSAPSLAVAMKIALIWVVALAASATSAHLVARAVRAQEQDRAATREPHD